MKKFITAIIAIMLVAVLGVSFIACDGGDVDLNAPEGFGEQMPTQEAKVKITSDMTATQMIMAAAENYYNADFVASTGAGKIDTEVLSMKFTQFVNSDKIRKGSVTGGKYTQFSNNLSGSIGVADLVKIWEETYIIKDANGEDIRYRSVDKNDLSVDKKNTTVNIKDGKTFKATEKFDNFADYQDAKAANPSLIWMYEINEDTVIADKCTKPVYDETTKTWSFKVVANPDTSTTEYQKQMMFMLKEQSGFDPSEFAFQTIELNVVMWENGYIKSLDLTESYFMKIDLKIFELKTTITLNSHTVYTYFDTEEGFTSTDLANKIFE